METKIVRTRRMVELPIAVDRSPDASDGFVFAIKIQVDIIKNAEVVKMTPAINKIKRKYFDIANCFSSLILLFSALFLFHSFILFANVTFPPLMQTIY